MPTLKLKDALGVWHDVPAIRGKTPKAKGQHIPGATYENFDWVTDGGSSYLYVYPTAASGVDLSDETHWMLIAKHGATIVSATFANDTITFTKDDGTTFNVTLAGIVAATTAANNAATLANTKAGEANAAKVSTEAATLSALAALDSNATWTKDARNPAEYYPAPLAPLYFKIEGSFTQAGSGDPSPTNIRPITPWMANGAKAKLANSGKNLIGYNGSLPLTNNGVTMTRNADGSYRLSGTASGYPVFNLFTFPIGSLNGTYTLKHYFSASKASVVRIRDGSAGGAVLLNSSVATPAVSGTLNNKTNANLYCDVSVSNTFTGTLDIYFQLELGSVATAYEPYVGSTAELTAPEEIAAGWMDNRGNGQKTWARKVFDGSDSVGVYDLGNVLRCRFANAVIGEETAFPLSNSTHFKYLLDYSNDISHHYIEGTVVRLYIPKSILSSNDVAGVNAYLAAQYAAGTPVTVVYQLATPTALTPVSASLNTIPATDLTQERLNIFTSSMNGILTYPKSKVGENRKFWNSQLWRKTASSNPVSVYPVPESPLYPKVSGTFTQAGTGDPSPENIRPITPWLASGGQVKVKRTGKNLFDKNLVANASAGEVNPVFNNYYRYIIYTSPNTQVIVSTAYGSANKALYMKIADYAYNITYGWIMHDTSQNTPFSVTSDSVGRICIYTQTSNYSKSEYSVALGAIQIELGSTATPYEPYSGQEITLAAPQEIPAGWMDGEGRGQVTWAKHVLDGTGFVFHSSGSSVARFYIPGFSPYAVNAPLICNKFKTLASDFTIEGIKFSNTNELNIYILKSRLTGWDDAWSNAQKLTAFKSWMAENPVTICAQMSTPVSIAPAIAPLTAIPQLDRVTPRQNVLTASTGNVELTYAKSPIREADELAAAIALL